jgi:hypothetical protein
MARRNAWRVKVIDAVRRLARLLEAAEQLDVDVLVEGAGSRSPGWG